MSATHRAVCFRILSVAAVWFRWRGHMTTGSVVYQQAESTDTPATRSPARQAARNEGAPILVRWTWTLHRPSGRLTEAGLDDHGNEFPRIARSAAPTARPE
jgi:hypothetical protein